MIVAGRFNEVLGLLLVGEGREYCFTEVLVFMKTVKEWTSTEKRVKVAVIALNKTILDDGMIVRLRLLFLNLCASKSKK